MAHDQTVARTILDQLGGRRFIAMTGASSFSSAPAALHFRIPKKNQHSIGGIIITLTAADDYTIETVRLVGSFETGDLRAERTVASEGVYAENLREAFTRITGLDTRL